MLATRARRGRVLSGATLVETPTDTPGTASIVAFATQIDPGTIALGNGQTFQLDVIGTDRGNGDILTGFSESWSSSNTGVATVSSNGLVTWVAAGTTTIGCTITKNGVSATDSSPAVVLAGAAVVTQMTRTPTTLSVATGGTSTITMQALDASGNAVSGQTYTAASNDTGKATVSVSGNVATVTGVADGTCTITCDVPAASITPVTVAVTVSTASASWPNEPAGLTTLFENDFSTKPPATAGASGSAGVWQQVSGTSNHTIITDSSIGVSAPNSPPNISRLRYPSGQRVAVSSTRFDCWGTSLGGSRPHYDTFYLGFWINMWGQGSDFQMQVTQIKPVGYIGYGESRSGASNQGYWIASIPTGTEGLVTQWSFNFRQQGDVSRSVPGSTTLLVNTWYLIEFLATANTTIVAGGVNATADGTLKQWKTPFGGASTLFCNRTDMAWKTTGNTLGFHYRTWTNIYGGTGGIGDKDRNDDILLDAMRGSGA